MDITTVIIACKNGDRNAFRELMNGYSDFAFSVAFRILNKEEDSQDVVQESFITVWEKIQSFKIEKNFSNWLYRIIVNKCYDALRKNKTVMLHPDAQQWEYNKLISDLNPDHELNNKELGTMIRTLTKNLSHKQKVVFILSELEGLSHDTIAEITGMAKTSIKSNLNHARRNIGEVLKKHL